MDPVYPSLLRPNTTHGMQLGDTLVEAPKAELHFRKWLGAPIADTLGGKALIDFGGRPLFAELCIYELIRLSGWEARWIQNFGAASKYPKLLVEWLDVPRKSQRHSPIPPGPISASLELVSTYNNGSFSGCWDVLGWCGDRMIFNELKRKRKDRLHDNQYKWLSAAIEAGLKPDNFLVVEWDFLS